MYNAKMCFEQMHKDHPYVLDGMDMYVSVFECENITHECWRIVSLTHTDNTGTHAPYSPKTMTQAWEDSSIDCLR